MTSKFFFSISHPKSLNINSERTILNVHQSIKQQLLYIKNKL